MIDTKIALTRCQILPSKSTKSDFGRGSAQDPARKAYSSPPDPLAVFRALFLRERGKGGEEKGGKGTVGTALKMRRKSFFHFLLSFSIVKSIDRGRHCMRLLEAREK